MPSVLVELHLYLIIKSQCFRVCVCVCVCEGLSKKNNSWSPYNTASLWSKADVKGQSGEKIVYGMCAHSCEVKLGYMDKNIHCDKLPDNDK